MDKCRFLNSSILTKFANALWLLATFFLFSGGGAKAQAITVNSFDCGGVATANLAAGDVITANYSIAATGTFASAIVRTPQPPFQLYSGVLSQAYVSGVPVTLAYTLTVTPVGGTVAALAVTNFGNNVAVVCPTYQATVVKAVDTANVSALPATLTYTITVDNTGTGGLASPVITDTLEQSGGSLTMTTGPTLTSGDVNTNSIIDPTETWVYTATYAVTQVNMDDAGDILNFASFSAIFFPATNSNTVTTTITAAPDITVVKTADDTTDVLAGQLITYSYVVTNSGNQTVTSIDLSDIHGGSGPAPTPSGETLTTDVVPLGDSTDAKRQLGQPCARRQHHLQRHLHCHPE